MSVFVTVLTSLTKYSTRQLKVGRVYFGPQCDVTVHHHGEDTAGTNKKGSNGVWLIGKQLVVLYPQLVHRGTMNAGTLLAFSFIQCATWHDATHTQGGSLFCRTALTDLFSLCSQIQTSR